MQNKKPDIFDISKINSMPWRGYIASFDHFTSSALIEDASEVITSCFTPLFLKNKECYAREQLDLLSEYAESNTLNDDLDKPRFYISYAKEEKPGRPHSCVGFVKLITEIPGQERNESIIRYEWGNNATIQSPSIVELSLSYLLFRAILIGCYSSWEHALEDVVKHPMVRINIIEDKRIAPEELLVLCHNQNPLLLEGQTYSSPEDRISSFKSVYVQNDKDQIKLPESCLKIVSLTDKPSKEERKAAVSYDEPTLIMHGRHSFAAKAFMLKRLGMDSVTFYISSEDFNSLVDEDNVPELESQSQIITQMSEEEVLEAKRQVKEEFLNPLVESEVSFVIFDEDNEIIQNKWSEALTYTIESLL